MPPERARTRSLAELIDWESAEVDATVRFQSSGDSETVVITGPGGERVLSFRFGPDSTLDDIDAAVRAILDAIEQLSAPRGPGSDRVA